MAHLITSNNCLSAWSEACKFIIENGDGNNLLMVIEEPLNFNAATLSQIDNYDIFSVRNVHDVINTIFPFKLYQREKDRLTLEEFYDRHKELFDRGREMSHRNKTSWGNYFLRFTKFGEDSKNQLQKIIDAINQREKQYSACYIMHVSSADTDNNTKNLGNPCLQYVQFSEQGDALHLTAVYRNHDFLNKALGNYIGLAQLLKFVADVTDYEVGSVTCHSIHYYLDSKRKIEAYLTELNW